MQKFEQLQPRRRRQREESVPSTFPEVFTRIHGGSGDDTDDFLDRVTEVLTAHEHLNEEARHRLGHLGIEAS